MSISAAELSAEVLANLELDASVTADVARFKVYENLSAAQLHLLNILPIQFLRDGIKEGLFNLESGEAEYQWPIDFIRFIELYLDYDGAITRANPGVKATVYDHDIFIQPIKSIGTVSFPFIDLEIQDGYVIAPAPTAVQADGGMVLYIYKPPNIAVGQDSALNPNLKNLLIYHASAASALIDQYRPDLNKLFMDMYAAELSAFLPKEEPKK